MLAGEKPLAMFSDTIPSGFDWSEADFQPHVDTGTFVKREKFYQMPGLEFQFRDVYYALLSEAWHIEKLHAIHAALRNGIRPATDDDEREIGRVLGYSKEHVELFIKRIRGHCQNTPPA